MTALSPGQSPPPVRMPTLFAIAVEPRCSAGADVQCALVTAAAAREPRRASSPPGWVGFWLWALVGAGLVFGFMSSVIFLLIPPVVLRSCWSDSRHGTRPRRARGLVAGAGLPLLVVAGLNWSDWQHRIVGDGTPNPYYWGGVGLLLLAAGVAGYAICGRRRP